MDTPLVSIVIPVYNGSNFLAEAIQSSLDQIYPNVEIIVVNDGSADDGKTEAMAKSFGDKIRYFSKPNGGVSSALNLGIQKMNGEYFCWLSHDDKYFPDKVSRQMDFIKNNSSAMVVASHFNICEEDTGREMRFSTRNMSVISSGRQLLSTWVFFCTLLIHKSCFEKAGLFDELDKTTQDTEMQIRLVQHYPMYILDEVLMQHRSHSEQTSKARRTEHRSDQNELMRTILKRYDLKMFAEKEEMDRHETFKTLIWLGDYALRKQAYRGAEYCYRKALRVKPFSPLLLLQLTFGLKNWLTLTKKR